MTYRTYAFSVKESEIDEATLAAIKEEVDALPVGCIRYASADFGARYQRFDGVTGQYKWKPEDINDVHAVSDHFDGVVIFSTGVMGSKDLSLLDADYVVYGNCNIFDKKPGDGISDRSMVSTNGGKGIIDTLIGVAESNGAELMMDTRALQIIMEGGKAAGVIARSGDTDYTISAKAVMLACGGFDGEDWSKQLYAPGTVGWHTFSTPTNTGDGIELAREAGALTLLKGGLSQIHLVGRDPLPLNDELSKLRMVNTGVFVTDLGYRCANESMTSQFDYFVPFVQSGRKEFTIICDSQQPADRLDLIKKAVEVGVASTADTIEELAVAAELPQYPLVKTIEHYNELCAAGEDPDFHKKPEDLQALTQAPFYAIQITPNTNDSFGQLAISTKAEVLDENRQPVAGLYAGGTIANAELFYMRYAVSGASMCMGTVTGRIAAQEAMKYYGA